MPDVVVVGAGHNGLVAACYLAQAGLAVEVVERDEVAGGAVSTVERFPGYLVDRGSSAHIMIRRTGIIEELDLAACGLRYVDCDPWGFAPIPEGGGITFWRDVTRTCASIEAVCGAGDADAYARFVDAWSRRNRAVFDMFQGAPTAGRIGKALWSIGGTRGGEIAREFLQPGDALLDAWFSDERLKTALAWLGAQSGPPTHEVGTADLVAWNVLLHDIPPGRPVGGSGALTQALVRRLASYAGSVRLGDGARKITTYRGEVTGVTTQSGDHIKAPVVVAGCHVLTTLALLGDEARLADARRRLRVGDGGGLVVRLGARDLPRYPGAPADGTAHHGLQLLARSRQQLRAAHGAYGAGRLPSDPPLLVMTFSTVDPSIAPAGRHNVSVWAQWYPYPLAEGGGWDAVRRREGERVVEAVDRWAPGFAGSVEHLFVQTPLDLERELGLLRGNVMHLEMGLDAMFALRPLPEWAHYRGPVHGLYLTGASTHPGGGVFGASGRSSARAVLSDVGARKLGGRHGGVLTRVPFGKAFPVR